MYKYLLWDVDGTLLDFKAAEKAAIRRLFHEFDFGECSDEDIATYSAINDKYWKALERNEITKPQVLIGRFLEFFEIKGLDLSKAESFNSNYQLALGDTIVFCDEADKLLKELKGQFVQAAITNGTKVAQDKKLHTSGLDEVLDAIFISEVIGVEKPNRGFFERVFEKLEITNPREVLVIGDSLTSDILGGVNAGVDTCWYNPHKAANPGTVQPTYEIADLNDLKTLIFS